MPVARFFIGNYMHPGPYFEAHGKGLLTCDLDLETGAITQRNVCPAAGNATFLAKVPNTNHLYVAVDNYFDVGELRTFEIGEDGSLSVSGTTPCGGGIICHVSLDSSGSRAFVSSYQDGTVSMHPVTDGIAQPFDKLMRHEGRSVNAERQECSHAHASIVLPGDQYLIVVDLGSDTIWLHSITDLRTDKVPDRHISILPGAGPRHAMMGPQSQFLYLFCELDAAVHRFPVNPDSTVGRLVDTTATLPAQFDGVPSGSAIKFHPSGKTLYVSNRNHNSIGVLERNASDGSLRLATTFDCLGDEPRDAEFDPSGRWLLVANQYTNQIISFEVSTESGLPTGAKGVPFDCGSPVCILFD